MKELKQKDEIQERYSMINNKFNAISKWYLNDTLDQMNIYANDNKISINQSQEMERKIESQE